MILSVLCPKCGNKQMYGPKGKVDASKSKRCVYCGRNFRVYKSINSHSVIKIQS